MSKRIVPAVRATAAMSLSFAVFSSDALAMPDVDALAELGKRVFFAEISKPATQS